MTQDPSRDDDARIAFCLSYFDSQHDKWVQIADTLDIELAALLRNAGLKHFTVTSRPKSRERFEAKVRRDPWREVEDTIGIRVCCFFESDLPAVEEVIREHWIVDDGSWVDKSQAISPAEFGYRSVQFVCRLREPDWPKGAILQEWTDNVGQTVEVQLRTALSHVWSELEHERYEHPETRTRETDRLWALTSALIEQADENLDQIRQMTGYPVGVQPRPAGQDLERFVQYHPQSRLLDIQIATALDLPRGTVFKSERELGDAVSDAGWSSWEDFETALDEHGSLGRRFALVVAPTDYPLILADWEPAHGALVFGGTGLFYTAIARALATDRLPLTKNQFGDRAHRSLPDQRLIEYRTVIDYLAAHADRSALEVRARYQAQKQSFTPIMEDREWKAVVLD